MYQRVLMGTYSDQFIMFLQHLKSQYSDQWKFEVLLEFNFEDDCNELQIQFSMGTYENKAKVELLSDMKVAYIEFIVA